MQTPSCGPLREGDVLEGKYTVRACIGEGGMGRVFLADQPALHRQVAIKVLRPELASYPPHVQRMGNEAIAACRVRSPHTLSVIDCNALPDGTPYIVMHHVPGRSLGRVIGEEPVRLARVFTLFAQVLSAIGATHDRDVVHADVKSDNFLVETLADRDHVTLIDFGLAQAPGQRLAFQPAHDEHVISGTPHYMAPEVICGERPTRSSDLYAAGVLLYELLTGAPPFTGTTSMEIMLQHQRDEVIPPSVRQPDRGITPALDEVVMRALAKRPAARFADAREFGEALQVAAAATALPEVRRPHRAASLGPTSPTVVGTAARPRGRADELAAGSQPGPRDALLLRRSELGHAILRGDVAQVVDGYLELAGALQRAQRCLDAAHELQEGIDLLGTGDTAHPDHGQQRDRLVVALAALYDGMGARQMARRVVSGTDRSSTLTCSPP